MDVEGDEYDSRIQGGILADGDSISRSKLIKRPQRLSRWSLHNHSHVNICTKQRSHLSHSMCQSKSRLLLLFLPLHHGSFFQIRSRLRCYPLCRTRWDDDIPLHRRRRLGYSNSRNLRILTTKPFHHDLCLVRRCRRHPRSQLVQLFLHVFRKQFCVSWVFGCNHIAYGGGVCTCRGHLFDSSFDIT